MLQKVQVKEPYLGVTKSVAIDFVGEDGDAGFGVDCSDGLAGRIGGGAFFLPGFVSL